MPFDGREFGRSDFMRCKLDQVIDLLSAENRWCKGGMRTTDGKRCIQAALEDAQASAFLTVPVLQAVRELTGWSFSRVDYFNDHPGTNHPLVVSVLHRARQNVLLGKIAPARTVSAARFVRTLHSALAKRVIARKGADPHLPHGCPCSADNRAQAREHEVA